MRWGRGGGRKGRQCQNQEVPDLPTAEEGMGGVEPWTS